MGNKMNLKDDSTNHIDQYVFGQKKQHIILLKQQGDEK